MPRSLYFLIFTVLCSSLCVAQEMEAGREAANRGDFETALLNWVPLAEAGDSEAQFNLGRMYARGDGVMQDYIRAFDYFKRAAEHGHKKAAEKLSTMYRYGDGVAKNPAQADYWKRVSIGREKIIPVEKAVPIEKVIAPPTAAIPTLTSHVTPAVLERDAPENEEWRLDQAESSAPEVIESSSESSSESSAESSAEASSASSVEHSSSQGISSKQSEWAIMTSELLSSDEEPASSISSKESVSSSGSSSSVKKLNLVHDDEDY